MSQSTEMPSEASALPFTFTGSGSEFFKIWVVNFILSILTLGIYSAWAKVRTNRYFYGNTRLGDAGFEYHAKPMAILKGRLIAVSLLLVYVLLGNISLTASVAFAVLLAIISPWIIWRSIQFNARMTSYRNVRFGFTGELKKIYKYLLLLPWLPLLAAVVIGILVAFSDGTFNPQALPVIIALGLFATYLMVPFIQKLVTVYYIDNHQFGQGKLKAGLSAGKYYQIYLALIGWSILLIVGVVIVVSLLTTVFLDKNTGMMILHMLALNSAESAKIGSGLMMTLMFVIYLPFFVMTVWFKAYINTKVRNYVYQNVELDNVLKLESNMTVWKLFRFYMANILLMIATLGLAYPWVKVRIAQFNANATRAHVRGSLDQYVNAQQDKQSALGDEMGEAFDVAADMGLAF